MILWWTFWITLILNAIFCPPARVTSSVDEHSNRFGFDLTGSVFRDACKLNGTVFKDGLALLGLLVISTSPFTSFLTLLSEYS